MEQEQEQKHALWVDFTKTIGIWLIVLGQMKIPPHMVNFIFAFHLSLFFFVAGYLEKNKKTLKEAIITGVNAVIIPYVIFYGFFYVYWFFTEFLGHHELYANEPLIYALGKPLAGMFLGIGRSTQYSTMLNPSLWFLVGLFFVRMIHKIIAMICKERICYYIAGSCITIIIMIILKYIHKPLILSIDCAILAFPYFALGNIAQKKGIIEFLEKNNKLLNIIISLVCYTGIVIAVKYNGQADMSHFIYGKNGFLFYILGMAGITATVCLSTLYKHEIKIITIISSGTMIILALHNLLNLYIYKVINLFTHQISFPGIIIISAVNILLTTIVIVIAKKHFPIILGEKKKRLIVC